MVTGQSIVREAFEQLEKSVHVNQRQEFLNTTLGEVWYVNNSSSPEPAKPTIVFSRAESMLTPATHLGKPSEKSRMSKQNIAIFDL